METAPVCQQWLAHSYRYVNSPPIFTLIHQLICFSVTCKFSRNHNKIVKILFTSFSKSLGPCMPMAVVTNSDCNSSIGLVSWTASNINQTYLAVATGLDGHNHECVTNTSSCTWDDLHCGEEYTVQVMARNGNCTSLPSNGPIIHMGMRPFHC